MVEKFTRKSLNRHLKNEEVHTALELLNNGVQVWFYRAPSYDTVIEVLRWLRKENLVEMIECP